MRTLVRTENHWLPTVLRLALGVMIFAHGAQKLLGWFGGPGYSATMTAFTGMGIPAFLVFMAIVAEFFGGLGLILGFLTRIAALGVAIDMVVAALLAHVGNGFFMDWQGTGAGHGFEFHVLAVALGVAAIRLGGGALSIDRAIYRRRYAASDTREQESPRRAA